MIGPAPRPGEPLVERMLRHMIETLGQEAGLWAKPGVVRRVPQTDDELWDYVHDTWGVQIPRLAVCDGHVAPFQAFADAYFVRDSMIVWESSRGLGGKSYLLATLGLTIATTRGGNVNILGGSGEQSKRVHDYMIEAWQHPHAPRHLLRTDPMKTITRLSNGTRIQALVASSTSVRGSHVENLLLDECDEMDLEIFDAAMGQTMASEGRPAVTVMSSTHQYPNGTMTEIKRRARLRGYLQHSWCVDGNSDIMGIYGMIKLKDIRVGDVIYAHDHDQLIRTTVVDHWCSGTRPTVIIRYGTHELTCTPDHRILTTRGWVEAGCLQPGDHVYQVSSAPDQITPPPPLSNLSRGSHLPGVWDDHPKRWQALQAMQPQDRPILAPRQTPASRSHLSRVSRDEAETLIPLPSLPHPRARRTEYHAGRLPHAGAATDCGLGDREETPKPRRVGRQGVTRSALLGLPRAGTVRALCRRFCATRVSSRHRSQWPLLAYLTGPASQGRAQTADGRSRGMVLDGLARGRAPSVGLAVVRAVRPGPTIPVYDLTVARGRSFIANSIVVHNCYQESLTPHGWLELAEVARKRRETTEVMFQSEYDLQEPSAESRAIMPAAVEALFDRGLGCYEGRPREYIEVEAPVPEGRYAHGADWAKAQDFTEIITLRLDVYPARLVAYERLHRLPWPQMVARFDARQVRYGLEQSRAAHDGTGLGDVVDGYLTQDAEKILMVGRRRLDLFSNFINAIENGELVAPYITSLYDQYKYCSRAHLEGAGHPPDGFVAGAMAWYAATLPPKRRFRPVGD